MRKRLISSDKSLHSLPAVKWLDLQAVAQIEISSEDPGSPIESALIPGAEGEWCAGESGEQTIRMIFDTPQSIRRIYLVVDEQERPRTQEFVLRWSENSAEPFHDICRQQWNFNPPHNTREVEHYSVNLTNVAVLELSIKPDISGGEARARLRELRVG
jgi:hypothetical protein